MIQIIIGTTPTITYTFHVVSPADLTKAILTIKNAGNVILEKTLADAVVGENSLSWTLTQQEQLDSHLMTDGTASTGLTPPIEHGKIMLSILQNK